MSALPPPSPPFLPPSLPSPLSLSVLSLLHQVPILSESLDVCLSKVHWSPSGHHLACGDSEGRVHIFEAGEVRHVGVKVKCGV